MWLGVAAAVSLSTIGAIGLHVANRSLTLQARETMEGALALVAVAGITYMIVWMHRHSATLRADLEGRADSALTTGSVAAIVTMAFVAVLREGLETAIFLLATFENINSPAAAASGAALGIVLAVALGYGIYRGGVRINLRRFFRVTGIVLVIVAAGLLAAAVHEFAEAGVVTFLQEPAVDLSWLIAPGTVRSSLLTAFFGFQPVPTVAEVVVWAAFLIPMVIYVTGLRLSPKRRLAV
jgi:high-affinity iron transporter